MCATHELATKNIFDFTTDFHMMAKFQRTLPTRLLKTCKSYFFALSEVFRLLHPLR